MKVEDSDDRKLEAGDILVSSDGTILSNLRNVKESALSHCHLSSSLLDIKLIISPPDLTFNKI